MKSKGRLMSHTKEVLLGQVVQSPVLPKWNYLIKPNS